MLQVPTLETPEGGVWESNAIARYIVRLSDNGLLGSTPLETVRGAPFRTVRSASDRSPPLSPPPMGAVPASEAPLFRRPPSSSRPVLCEAPVFTRPLTGSPVNC